MNQSKQLTEGAIFVAIFIIIMLATFIPFLSIFAMFLIPLPFVIYTTRHGIKPGMLVFVVAAVISVIFMTVLSLPVTFTAGVGGLLTGHGIYRKRSAYETWGLGILGYVLGLLFSVIFMQIFFQINFGQELEKIAMESVESYANLIEGFGIIGGTDVNIQEMLQEQVRLMINLLPVFIAMAAVTLALITQWLSYKIINRINKENYRFPPFRNLNLPMSIVWIYIIVLFTTFFDIDPTSTIYIGLQNLLVLTEILLIVQGFSFVFFYTHIKKMSRAIPFLTIIITIFFPVFLLYFIRILGIIDIIFSMRKRIADKHEGRK